MKERSSSSALMARSATAAGSGSRVANDPEDTLGATSSTHAGAPLSVAGPSQAQDECTSPVSTTTPPWPPTAPTSSSRAAGYRSEEPTSELQSLMRTSYAVFCLKKKKQQLNEYKVHY